MGVEKNSLSGKYSFTSSVYTLYPQRSSQEAMAFLDEVDGGILSYRDHVVKPDQAIYRLLTERYSLVPQKTVFIDDTPVNAQAARDLGWHAIDYKDYDQAVKELHDLGVRY